jgi:hypothetical protein
VIDEAEGCAFLAGVRPILTTPIHHVRLLERSAELAALETPSPRSPPAAAGGWC